MGTTQEERRNFHARRITRPPPPHEPSDSAAGSDSASLIVATSTERTRVSTPRPSSSSATTSTTAAPSTTITTSSSVFPVNSTLAARPPQPTTTSTTLMVPSSTPLAGSEPPPEFPIFGPISFSFAGIRSMESCTPSTITWSYTGPPDEDMSLLIAASSTPQLQIKPDLSFMPLAAGIDATLEYFTWSSVDYPAGCAGGSCVANATPTATPSPKSSLLPLQVANTTSSLPPSPSASSAAWSKSATATGNKRASVIAGGVVAGIAILGVAILAGICIRFGLRRRSRVTSSSRGRRAYQHGTWMGLSSGDTNEESECSAPMDERPSFPASTDMRASVISRLEPNRRRASTVFLETTSPEPPPPPQKDSLRLSTNRLSVPIVDIKRGDSPTLPVSPYRTRKPVPPLDPLDDAPPRKLPPTPSTESQSTGFPSLDSPVPSTATSAMYRMRDSGTSSRTRPYGDGEECSMARASSLIDPGQFGAMKTMYSLVPDMPPLPSNGVRADS
ncbi:hypothetical protein OH77DRAFT_1433806 [Trametes cingulata]|nr:hypothetical protein OH77DRAFT_1433806 [Trametes cingulata]